jgi:CrcB protein
MIDPSSNLFLVLLIGIGGAAGAITRATTGRLLQGDFPFSTLIVNVVGSYVFAILNNPQTPSLSPQLYAFAAIGFCGALTTFSTFILETVLLYRAGFVLKALLNLSATLLLCILASLVAIL